MYEAGVSYITIAFDDTRFGNESVSLFKSQNFFFCDLSLVFEQITNNK